MEQQEVVELLQRAREVGHINDILSMVKEGVVAGSVMVVAGVVGIVPGLVEG